MNNISEVFGLAAVIAMVTTYALEQRSHWFVLVFALSCAAAALYAVLIQSPPFALAEGIWAAFDFLRWRRICESRFSAGVREIIFRIKELHRQLCRKCGQ